MKRLRQDNGDNTTVAYTYIERVKWGWRHDRFIGQRSARRWSRVQMLMITVDWHYVWSIHATTACIAPSHRAVQSSAQSLSRTSVHNNICRVAASANPSTDARRRALSGVESPRRGIRLGETVKRCGTPGTSTPPVKDLPLPNEIFCECVLCRKPHI